ncbi:hypothetical protein T06_10059, partial [Trichinella sp. T6]
LYHPSSSAVFIMIFSSKTKKNKESNLANGMFGSFFCRIFPHTCVVLGSLHTDELASYLKLFFEIFGHYGADDVRILKHLVIRLLFFNFNPSYQLHVYCIVQN